VERAGAVAELSDWQQLRAAAKAIKVGDGLVDNQKLAQLLKDANYSGFLAVETDHLHPDYHYDERAAVRQSIAKLREISANLN